MTAICPQYISMSSDRRQRCSFINTETCGVDHTIIQDDVTKIVPLTGRVALLGHGNLTDCSTEFIPGEIENGSAINRIITIGQLMKDFEPSSHSTVSDLTEQVKLHLLEKISKFGDLNMTNYGCSVFGFDEDATVQGFEIGLPSGEINSLNCQGNWNQPMFQKQGIDSNVPQEILQGFAKQQIPNYATGAFQQWRSENIMYERVYAAGLSEESSSRWFADLEANSLEIAGRYFLMTEGDQGSKINDRVDVAIITSDTDFEWYVKDGEYV